MTPARVMLALIAAALICSNARAQRQMEYLNRGLIAIVRADGKVFLSWRLLATDPENISFNVYRDDVKLNDNPISTSTNFLDSTFDLAKPAKYTLRPIIDAHEADPAPALILPRQYLEIPLKTSAGYAPNDASVADLDGDGEYEIVIHMAGRGRDNSFRGATDPPILHAYKLDGTLLWSINLGKNIREGAHYTQFMVYDLDGDGRAEIA